MTRIKIAATNATIPTNAVYTAPNAPTTGAGTAASPIDLRTAIANATAGNTIVLTGTSDNPYRLAKLGLNKRLRIVAKPGTEPVISGAIKLSSASFVLETATGLYYLPNYTIQVEPVEEVFADPKVPLSRFLQQVFIDDVYQERVGAKSLVTPGSTKFYIQAATTTTPARLYIGVNPVGKTVEVSKEDVGLDLVSGATDSEFIGFGVEKYARFNFQITGSNSLMFNKVTSWHSGFANFQVMSTNGSEFRDCIAGYAGSTGYRLRHGVKNSKFIGGEIVGCNTAKFAVYYGASGLKVIAGRVNPPNVQGNVYEGIKVHHNDCFGIWLDEQVRGARVTRNHVHDNNYAGIMVEISQDNYIVNNICERNVAGIFVQHCERTRVWNNTLVNNRKNLWVHDTNRRHTDANLTALGVTFATRDNEFVNNILDRSGTSSGAESTLLYSDIKTTRTTTTNQMVSLLANNAYYRASATAPANIHQWYTEPNVKENYTSLSTFKAENPGYDVGSIGRTGEASHPFFADANLTIKSTSPTKGTGKAVYGVIAEILGVAAGTVVDMGANFTLGTVTSPEPEPEPTDPCAARIRDAVAEVEIQLQGKNEEVILAQAEVANLTSQVTTLNNQVKSLTDTVNAKNLEIASLQNQIASGSGDTAALNAQIASLQSQVTGLNTELGALQAKLAQVRVVITEEDKLAKIQTIIG